MKLLILQVPFEAIVSVTPAIGMGDARTLPHESPRLGLVTSEISTATRLGWSLGC